MTMLTEKKHCDAAVHLRFTPQAVSLRVEMKATLHKYEKMIKDAKPGQCLATPPIRASKDSPNSWQLVIYPAGMEKGKPGAELCVKLPEEVAESVNATFDFYLLKDDGSRVNIARKEQPFSSYGSSGLIAIGKDKAAEALHADGSLVVACQLEFETSDIKFHAEEVFEKEDDCVGKKSSRKSEKRPRTEELMAKKKQYEMLTMS